MTIPIIPIVELDVMPGKSRNGFHLDSCQNSGVFREQVFHLLCVLFVFCFFFVLFCESKFHICFGLSKQRKHISPLPSYTGFNNLHRGMPLLFGLLR